MKLVLSFTAAPIRVHLNIVTQCSRALVSSVRPSFDAGAIPRRLRGMFDSRIEAVTVYRRGARVTRAGVLNCEGEIPREVRIGGLPLCLDDGSIRARLEALDGGAPPVAGALRVTLATIDEDPSLAPADDETLAAAEDELARLKSLAAQVQSDLELLDRLSLRARPHVKGEPPGPTPTAARAALVSLRTRRRRALDERSAELGRAIRDASERVADLRDRDARSSTARRTREHELRKCVVVSLRPVEGVAPRARLVIDYVVPGARWAPSYALRLGDDGDDARLELRAQIAQRTGEDWTQARVTLSTAAADAWTELAELPSRRIGRKQPPPKKRGWRAPPIGAEALYGDYDRAARRIEGDRPTVLLGRSDEGGAILTREGVVSDELTQELFLRSPAPRSDRAAQAPPAPPAAMAMPQAALAAPAKMRKSAGLLGGLGDLMGSAGTGAVAMDEPAPVLGDVAPVPEPMLAFGRLRMQPKEHSERGTLTVIDQHALYIELIAQHTEITQHEIASRVGHARRDAEAIDDERLPPKHHLAWSGTYDYAYATETVIDVPSDGEFHNVPVSACDAKTRVLFVVVPRESEDVFRVARIANGLATPLMAGPVDVYMGTDYLVTSELSFTPSGGELRIGLGVAQGVKVARNARFREESAGLMKGALVLHHAIEVDVQNHAGRAIELEVRERVPVVREGEEDIKLEIGDVSPPWSTFDPRPEHDGDERLRGGHRWTLELADGERQTLSARYAVRIASKNELVGGNRREA